MNLECSTHNLPTMSSSISTPFLTVSSSRCNGSSVSWVTKTTSVFRVARMFPITRVWPYLLRAFFALGTKIETSVSNYTQIVLTDKCCLTLKLMRNAFGTMELTKRSRILVTTLRRSLISPSFDWILWVGCKKYS